MGDARVLRVDCSLHGRLWDEAVYCQHDAEDVTRKVLNAHRPSYGADCAAIVHVALLDPETMEPVDQPTKHGYSPPATPEQSRVAELLDNLESSVAAAKAARDTEQRDAPGEP